MYFNTRSMSSFIVSAAEHRRMKTKLSDPITFELALPSVFNQFREWGFLVEEGVDEIGEIRYRYVLKTHDKSKAHILINLSDVEVNADGEFAMSELLSKLKAHLKCILSSPELKELRLEWYADNDKYYNKIIMPVGMYAKQECEVFNVLFASQLNIKALRIEKQSVLKLPNMSVDAIWADVIFVDRCSENLSDQGVKIRSLNRLLSYMDNTILENHRLHFNINLYIKKNSKKTPITSVVNFIPLSLKDNTSINVFSVSDDGSVMAEQPAMLTTLAQNEQWCKMDESAMMNYSINVKGEVYFGRYVSPDTSRHIGWIDDNGEITYDRLKQGHYYGQTWFENEKCLQCKYLPLLMDICSLKVVYYGNTRHISCPVADGTFQPDALMVRIFENKQNL